MILSQRLLASLEAIYDESSSVYKHLMLYLEMVKRLNFFTSAKVEANGLTHIVYLFLSVLFSIGHFIFPS